LVSKENRVKIKKEPALQKKGIVFVLNQEQQKEHGWGGGGDNVM